MDLQALHEAHARSLSDKAAADSHTRKEGDCCAPSGSGGRRSMLDRASLAW